MAFSTMDAETLRRLGEECQQLLLQMEYVLDSIDDGLVILDLEGNVVAMNKVAVKLFEFDRDEQVRRHLSEYRQLFEMSDPDGTLLPFEMSPLMRTFNLEKFAEYEVQVQRKGAGRLWIGCFSGAPVQNKAGETILSVVTVRDITVRRRTEETLHAVSGNLRQITTAMPVKVTRCDAQGRFLWVSDEYARWLGRPQEDIVGRSLADVIGRDALDSVTPYIARVLSGQRVAYEARLNYPELGPRWINATYMPTHDAQGRVDGWFGVIADVTEKKELEKELRRTNQTLEKRIARAVVELRKKDELLFLQGRHAVMGETISTIAHHWRQPLNLLALIAQDLQTTCRRGGCSKEYLDASITKSLDTIMHLSRMIDDFRFFLKPCREAEEFTIRDVLEKTLSLLGASLQDQKIRTEIQMEGDPTVKGCPTHLSQVLLNILNNARDAFAAGPVADPMVAIKTYGAGGKTVVTVTDNAGGIPAPVIKKIFDPYFSTKSARNGTGMGLFLCKSIVDRNLNGSISVRNVGSGAEFRIEI